MCRASCKRASRPPAALSNCFQQVLGHSQISLTLGTYSHVVPELVVEAAERVGTALWG